MGTQDLRDRADDAWEDRRWLVVVANLESLDAAGDADADDLDRLGRALYLVGRDRDSRDLLARAHRAHLDAGSTASAVASAFWLGLLLIDGGDLARGSGWVARAERLLVALPDDAVERGLLHLPGALQALYGGDEAEARAGFAAALAIAQDHDEPDLLALAILGVGQAAVLADDVETARARLDEAMVLVVDGEVSPIVAGIVYCAVISACHDTLELRRAREWTQALSEWCAAQPDLVPYRGQCLVHRAQVLALSGRWEEAFGEVADARDAFTRAGDEVAIGIAWYEQGELHRLRGEAADAERAYERAGRAGHEPQPGLALLRLAEGEVDRATNALERLVDAARGELERATLLPALVEARLAGGEVERARSTAERLAGLDDRLDVEWVRASAERALGAVCLAEGRPPAALAHLRVACETWRSLGIPHEVAMTRLLVARACRDTGDLDTARIEADAVRRTAADLGAAPLADLVDGLFDDEPAAPGGLTEREIEVLSEVATGKTNRAVAERLFISDKTVARHLSNIYTKLDLSSRAAATAWAYEHEVVGPSR
ncbi:LuxR family transcriptional regulator [Salsipaludibacter albus]|uniref:LuxR family transcriptional regulator n=1 Tax=Salsipaludibacter albus TaxID=2849650 RepID=UPI002368EACC|nr:LuxR family transcriptional regulator [Salsipaludibacter albus]MBY5162682.1 LuxR C-terminal-related transcriptional regulator [Salsipaludibacter albus]